MSQVELTMCSELRQGRTMVGRGGWDLPASVGAWSQPEGWRGSGGKGERGKRSVVRYLDKASVCQLGVCPVLRLEAARAAHHVSIQALSPCTSLLWVGCCALVEMRWGRGSI